MSAAEHDPAGRLARLADRAEITEVLALYCRGVDRCDIDTLRSVYHPDATDDHGTFRGNAHDFAAWAVQGGRTFWHASHHSVHNVIIEWIDGDTAHVESTVLGINRRRNDNANDNADAQETGNAAGGDGTIEVFAGRYVDRFERRDGVWRIAHRLALRDVDTLLERRRWAGRITEGGRHPDDPVYRNAGRHGTS